MTFSPLFFPINDFYIEELLLLLWVFPLCWRPSPVLYIEGGGGREINLPICDPSYSHFTCNNNTFSFLFSTRWRRNDPLDLVFSLFLCSLIERIAHRRRSTPSTFNNVLHTRTSSAVAHFPSIFPTLEIKKGTTTNPRVTTRSCRRETWTSSEEKDKGITKPKIKKQKKKTVSISQLILLVVPDYPQLFLSSDRSSKYLAMFFYFFFFFILSDEKTRSQSNG